MPVKFGAVHTGELGFAAHADAARAAHAYAVNHDGVEADRGFDAEGARGFGHSRHHGHRAHGHDFKDALVFFKPVAQKIRHKALVAVTAVIGGDEQFVDKGFQLVFKKLAAFFALDRRMVPKQVEKLRVEKVALEKGVLYAEHP